MGRDNAGRMQGQYAGSRQLLGDGGVKTVGQDAAAVSMIGADPELRLAAGNQPDMTVRQIVFVDDRLALDGSVGRRSCEPHGDRASLDQVAPLPWAALPFQPVAHFARRQTVNRDLDAERFGNQPAGRPHAF